MPTKYVHTNIIAKDLIRLMDFYVQVFGCVAQGKEYELYGDWLKQCVGLESAKLKGINLALPGYEKDGPVLEIFQYDAMHDRPDPVVANRQGFGHIAFQVEDMQATVQKALEQGGFKLGEIARKEFKTGTLHVIYMTDPEGNIVELQNWEPK